MSNIVPRLFQVPPRNWPIPPRGYKINKIWKLIKNEHIRSGWPKHLPPGYIVQNRSMVRNIKRNTNVGTLSDGAYLYLIEYDPKIGRYYKQFVPIVNFLEFGSRHFQLPTLTPGRVIIAAGELIKEGPKITFNLESGTYTKNIMGMTPYMSQQNFVAIVKNAFKNTSPVEFKNKILAPQIQVKLKNLLRLPPGSLTFKYMNKPTATLKKKPRYLNANLAKELMAQHRARVQSGNSSVGSVNSEKTSPVSVKRIRRSPRLQQNERRVPTQRVLRRS